MTRSEPIERKLEAIRQRAVDTRSLPSPAVRKALRIEAGVTAAEAAEAVGVSRQSIIYWENGARRPRGANAEKYAEVLRAFQGES